MEQPDLLNLANAAAARIERSRRRHREYELRGLADAPVGVVAEPAAEREHLHTWVAGVAVHERRGGERYAHLRTVLDDHRRSALEPVAIDPIGQHAVLVEPAADRRGQLGGHRLVVVCQRAQDIADRPDLIRARQLLDDGVSAWIPRVP